MSKKAFGYLRKKRVVPMPSLTSLRKYQREHGIVIHHNPNRTGMNLKGTSKKKAKKVVPLSSSNVKHMSGAKIMQAINLPVVPSAYEGQQIQIVNANGATIGKNLFQRLIGPRILVFDAQNSFRYSTRCLGPGWFLAGANDPIASRRHPAAASA